MHQCFRTEQATHGPVGLKLPPPAIISPLLTLILLNIAAENLLVSVAIRIEEVPWFFIEGKQVRVKQPVPSLVRQSSPHPTLRHLPLLGLQRGGNDDGIHARFGKSRVSQDAFRQVLVVMR